MTPEEAKELEELRKKRREQAREILSNPELVSSTDVRALAYAVLELTARVEQLEARGDPHTPPSDPTGGGLRWKASR